jgi:HNH endonuclease
METVSLTHPHAARALSPALDAPALDAPALDALGDEIASLAAQIHAATYRLLCLIRRALQTRDVCCGFPGCDNRRGLQAHHIRHWADGGHTKLHNLLSLCAFHHRLVHEGGFSISRDPETDVLCFARPDGQLLPAVPAPPAATAAQPPGAGLVAANRTAGLQITAMEEPGSALRRRPTSAPMPCHGSPT